MFKILELKNADTAVPAEVGHGYSTREQALAAVKKHLTTFKAAGRQSRRKLLVGAGFSKACESAGFQVPTEEDAAANAQFPKPEPSF